jgi:hypothetical protein
MSESYTVITSSVFNNSAAAVTTSADEDLQIIAGTSPSTAPRFAKTVEAASKLTSPPISPLLTMVDGP